MGQVCPQGRAVLALAEYYEEKQEKQEKSENHEEL
jgi:hypothetical protein